MMGDDHGFRPLSAPLTQGASMGPHKKTQPDRNPLSSGSDGHLFMRLLDNVLFGTVARQRHCYVKADDGTVYSLFPQSIQGQTVGVPTINDPADVGGNCAECDPACDSQMTQDDCFFAQYLSYPVGSYDYTGPNSNTFAGTLARACCHGGVPDGLGSAPGVDDEPPALVFITARPLPRPGESE